MGCGAETPLSPLLRRAAAPRLRGPLPSLKIKGCSVLLRKQVRSRAPGSRGGRCQDTPWVVGPAQLRGGRQGHGCACVGRVTVSVTDLPDVGGRVPGANRPSSHHEHPSSECSGEWLPLAAAVGCVWLANGEGPPRQRAGVWAKRRGKLVLAASAKGDFVSGANRDRSRWRDLETWRKPHSVLHFWALHTITNPCRMVEFQKEVETPRSVHPSAAECRTKWLGLICQKPRLCLEDDK